MTVATSFHTLDCKVRNHGLGTSQEARKVWKPLVFTLVHLLLVLHCVKRYLSPTSMVCFKCTFWTFDMSER